MERDSKSLAEAFEAYAAKLGAKNPLAPQHREILRRCFYVGASAYAQGDPKEVARELLAYCDAYEKARRERTERDS